MLLTKCLSHCVDNAGKKTESATVATNRFTLRALLLESTSSTTSMLLPTNCCGTIGMPFTKRRRAWGSSRTRLQSAWRGEGRLSLSLLAWASEQLSQLHRIGIENIASKYIPKLVFVVVVVGPSVFFLLVPSISVVAVGRIASGEVAKVRDVRIRVMIQKRQSDGVLERAASKRSKLDGAGAPSSVSLKVFNDVTISERHVRDAPQTGRTSSTCGRRHSRNCVPARWLCGHRALSSRRSASTVSD